MRNIRILSLFIGFLFIVGSLNADSITIATGETITATIGLTTYEGVCSGPSAPAGGCPTFPAGVSPFVSTQVPAGSPSLYSLNAELVSTNDGQVFDIGSLPLEVFGGSTPEGIFRYNGGGTGFLFPNDPTFFGPNPSEDTFEVVFQNTGEPFTLSPDNPTIAVEANLDSSETGSGIRVAEETISVTFSQVPEPNTLMALSAALSALMIFRKKRTLN
jgi:hypothetical protein